ncbi:SDR family oxidoreductase [Zunongwangia atlantica]|uniref:D-mannonate oxidoreductase n=1 Tax=Zunongwangia atlantica 22II14-10F7 TaxID=1185767 RepID=A0A1Y1T548_9FLAO|nr:SDR family oxidoreductase [Zunongwangia atlantica]ORL46171.1 D-mannonate oxidoreductase [Zunongwangia atlantica 22II14-10F7]|tara:strand:- start:3349 stop:4158 length:810 start_codon:yes stop_codon:yes gene_type:complete
MKTIVITGASGILCSNLATDLAKKGHKIALLDLNIDKAQILANSIKSKGGKALALEVDVLNKISLEAARIEVNRIFGPCDILINGAGGNHPKATTNDQFYENIHGVECSFFNLEAEGIKFVFDLNFMGTLLPTQVFANDMVKVKNGNIINISSMNAFQPLTKIPAYSAAKAATSNFTQWLSVYFSKVGIRVNAIAPGFFLTEQNRELLTTKKGNLTARGETIIKRTPLGRFGTPEDLISTTEWLCDEASSFITGIVIPVDGGFSAYSGI